MMIERMSLTWEEKGATEALTLGACSMAIAILCYGFMGNIYIEHFIMTFPEMLAIILGLSLMIGRYTGFRLLEFYRFRSV